ncbi:MAG: DUF2459 domain-containing protein [Pseudomonadota bacterium]
MNLWRRFLVGFVGASFFLIMALFVGAMPIQTYGSDTAGEPPKHRIYVLSNGFHSDIAVPKNVAQQMLPTQAAHFPVDHSQVEFFAIGWGSKTAFTSLLAVSDLTLPIVAKALAFDEGVIHVTPLGKLSEAPGIYAIDVSNTQLSQLGLALGTWFSSNVPMRGITQGFGDRFYKSRGAFSPWNTCNSWTGRRLREAGVAIGVWTPITQSLEFGLSRHKAIHEW